MQKLYMTDICYTVKTQTIVVFRQSAATVETHNAEHQQTTGRRRKAALQSRRWFKDRLGGFGTFFTKATEVLSSFWSSQLWRCISQNSSYTQQNIKDDLQKAVTCLNPVIVWNGMNINRVVIAMNIKKLRWHCVNQGGCDVWINQNDTVA